MQSTAVSPSKSGIQAQRRPPKAWIWLLLILAAGAIAFFWWQKTHPGQTGKIHISGRIEGYETNIGAKIPGRIDFIAVREGDLVKIGQLIVHLNDEDIQAQLRGAKALLKKSIDDRKQSEEQLHVTQSAVSQAALSRQQAIEDANGRIKEAEANVASARDSLAQAQANLCQAQADCKLAHLRQERYVQLAKRGAVTQDEADQATTNADTAQATVQARAAAVEVAEKQLLAMEAALTQTRSVRLNPPIRHQQLFSARHQFTQSQQSLQSATQQVANAKAAVDQILANIAYMNILSPINGVVTARAVEPGAVVIAGQTVLSLINLDTVYLRAYIPEGQIGRVRVGQKALVYLDSAPKKGLPGRVIEIDPEASFTPENIYFQEDRVKQVFGMKIAIDNPAGFAKPGMPADADILIEQ